MDKKLKFSLKAQEDFRTHFRGKFWIKGTELLFNGDNYYLNVYYVPDRMAIKLKRWRNLPLRYTLC